MLSRLIFGPQMEGKCVVEVYRLAELVVNCGFDARNVRVESTCGVLSFGVVVVVV